MSSLIFFNEFTIFIAFKNYYCGKKILLQRLLVPAGAFLWFYDSNVANIIIFLNKYRPVLSQVKQKTPIILPGFEVVSFPDELSGQYSVSCPSYLCFSLL